MSDSKREHATAKLHCQVPSNRVFGTTYPRDSFQPKSELIFVDHTILHDELKILLRIGHDLYVAQGISIDDQKISIGSGRNGPQTALHEQLGVDAGGRANDTGWIVEINSHFKFSEL